MKGRTLLIIGAVVAAVVVISCVGCLILGAIVGSLPTYEATSTARAVARVTDTPAPPAGTPTPRATELMAANNTLHPTDTPALPPGTPTPRAIRLAAATNTPHPTDTPALPTSTSTPTATELTAATDTPHPTDTPVPLTNTPAPTATSSLLTPTPIPPHTPAPTPIPEPQQFNGSGQQVSPQFTLNAGLAVFRMTHDGSRNFAIWLLDNGGERVELLVNEIGGFDGAKAFGIERTGTFILDILASGNWTVSVEQPAVTPSIPAVPQMFTGHGKQVSPLFRLDDGLVTFRTTHDGSRNFAIWLLDARGERVELLVNEIGTFDGAEAVWIRSTGAYLLDIAADGNWTIAVE